MPPGRLDGDLDLQRHLRPAALIALPAADHRRLGLQEVHAGLDDEEVDAAVEEATRPAPHRRRARLAKRMWPSDGSLVPGPIEPAT